MKLRNKKTGDIGELSVWYRADNKEIKEFGVIKENEKFPTDYKSLAELNVEWEDYEEPETDFYFYLDDYGCVQEDYTLCRGLKMRKEIGNCFETKEEAEKAAEKLKAWKRLKDKGYYFRGWRLDKLHFEIELRVKEYDFVTDELKQDLDLLFGSEEKD